MPPAIYLGGVQRRACALAGEVADGFVSHPTNSNPRYLRRRACRRWPRARVRRAGTWWRRVRDGRRHIGDHGRDAAAVARERERQRRLLAFLYSTPAYAPTLELYGWDDLGPRLRELIRRERWADLGAVLSDEVLDTLVPAGTFEELPGVLVQRFAGLGQGITVSVPGGRGGRRGIRRRRGRAASGLTPASARHREDELLCRHGVDRRWPLLVAHRRITLGRGEDPWQEPDVAGRAERVDARS